MKRQTDDRPTWRMAVEISYAVDVDGRPIPMITAPDGLSADDAKRMKRWIEDVQAA